MRRGIVITTSPYTKLFADDCIRSVETSGYPILLVVNDEHYGKTGIVHQSNDKKFTIYVNDWNGFELGGILRGSEFFDEFVHIMDTCVVEDASMFEKMFAHDGSVHLCRGFFSYLGKYQSEIIKKIGVPKIHTKEEAIKEEWQWNGIYLQNDPKAQQFQPELPVTTNEFVERHGRRNMVLKNGFITKYKATWK